MPKIEKAKRRQTKQRKAKYGMRVNGKSIEAILNALKKRGKHGGLGVSG